MKRLKYLITAAIIVIIATAAVAFGADAPAATTPAVSPIPAFLQATVFPVLTALLTGVVSLFLTRLGAKYKIEALTKKDNFVEKLAFQGIAYAKEQAAKYAESTAPLSGDDKLSLAVGYVIKAMPAVSTEQADRLVHSVLAQVAGEGATGEAVLPTPGTNVGTLAAFTTTLAEPQAAGA